MRVLLLIVLALIFALGLVMIFSTTSAEVLDHDLDRSTNQALLKQIAYALAGGGLAFGAWKMGYHRFLELSPLLLVFFSILLILTLIPGVGRVVNGSRRWIGVAGLSFQPSEFVKYVVPAYFIHRLLQVKSMTVWEFLKIIGVVAIPIFLILIEPNNGTAGVICLTVVVLCLLMHVPFKYWALPLMVFTVIGGVSAYNLPYVSGRLKVYMNPELDLLGRGHQPYQAKIAAGSGQMLGRGPGNSWQKLSYLPEAQNDYIAAIYAEEFGWIGMLVLISLYMFLAYLGFYLANEAQDPAGGYLAGGITFLICFQAFLNLGVVSGLLPSTGLNLPFFSQGGTSLIANLMGVSLLLQVVKDTKNNDHPRTGQRWSPGF